MPPIVFEAIKKLDSSWNTRKLAAVSGSEPTQRSSLKWRIRFRTWIGHLHTTLGCLLCGKQRQDQLAKFLRVCFWILQLKELLFLVSFFSKHHRSYFCKLPVVIPEHTIAEMWFFRKFYIISGNFARNFLFSGNSDLHKRIGKHIILSGNFKAFQEILTILNHTTAIGSQNKGEGITALYVGLFRAISSSSVVCGRNGKTVGYWAYRFLPFLTLWISERSKPISFLIALKTLFRKFY